MSFRTATARLLLALASLASFGASAAAQPSAADTIRAEAAFNSGVSASRQGDWTLAVAHFEESMLAAPRPATAYNLAIAHAHLRQYASTIRYADIFEQLTDPVRHAEPLREIALLREEATAHVATLTVQVVPAAAELQVDARVLDEAGSAELRLDPGPHRLEARADGFASRVLVVELVAGQHAVIAIELIPAGVAGSDPGDRERGAAVSPAAAASEAPGPVAPTGDTRRPPRAVARSVVEWGSLSLGAVSLGTAFALDLLAFRHARNLRDYDPGAVGFLNASLQYRRIRGAGIGMGLGGSAILVAAVSTRVWFDSARFRWGALGVGAAGVIVGSTLMVRTPPRVGDSALTAPHRALGSLLLGVGIPLLLVPVNARLRQRHDGATGPHMSVRTNGLGLAVVGGF